MMKSKIRGEMIGGATISGENPGQCLKMFLGNHAGKQTKTRKNNMHCFVVDLYFASH